MTLNIPLASKQTVFVLYEAKTIPMPYPDDPQLAITWKLEAPYLALSEDQMESSVLSKDQFEQCLGSSKYRICSETFPTELGHSSCIATLFFDTPLEALSVCETISFLYLVLIKHPIWVMVFGSSHQLQPISFSVNHLQYHHQQNHFPVVKYVSLHWSAV